MSDIQPVVEPEPGQWLLRPDVDWRDLVRYGPPGFDAYVRIRFLLGMERAHREGEAPGVRRALMTLAEFTATPAVGYAAIWEGWAGGEPAPDAAQVRIPHRTMLLFTGAVDVLRDAPARAWQRGGEAAEPHLVWPEDHAWCLACDVDEEVEFTVGCASDAAQALIEALPGAVRRVGYGDPAP